MWMQKTTENRVTNFPENADVHRSQEAIAGFCRQCAQTIIKVNIIALSQ